MCALRSICCISFPEEPGCGLSSVLLDSVRLIRGGVHVGCVVIDPHADVCFERSREVIVSGGGEWRERESGVMRG